MQLFGKDIKTALKNLILVIGGTVIVAFGTALFLLPNDLVAGGVSGIAIIINKLIAVDFITVDVIITVVTWTLFFLGLIILGKRFAMNTLISTIVYPPAISLFMRMASSDFLGGFFAVDPSNSVHLIISAIFYGITCGLGCALTFLGGGSSGGVDIIAFIITKFCKRFKSSAVIGVIDATIVILGMFIIGDFVLSLLGVLAVGISTVVIDKVFIGASKAFVAQIITENYETISRAVITDMNRTTTIINAVGGYSGKEHKMVMVSFTMRQYSELINVINKYDKNAFVTIHRAHEINGEGWTR